VCDIISVIIQTYNQDRSQLLDNSTPRQLHFSENFMGMSVCSFRIEEAVVSTDLALISRLMT